MLSPLPWSLSRHVARFLAPRGDGMAGDDERRAAAARGIDGFAVEWLAWRRSALWLATLVVVASASATTMDCLLHWPHHRDGRTELGMILELFLLRIALPWIVCALCLAAYLCWDRPRRSRWLVGIAATIEVLPAFMLAMLPPSWLVAPSHLGVLHLGEHALRLVTAIGLALRIVGILSAAFRSAVVAKMLVPESRLPGAIVLALTPINIGSAVVLYVAVNSAAQGWALVAAWACFVVVQLSYLRGGAALLRPTEASSVGRLFRSANQAKLALLPLAVVLGLVFVLTGVNSLGEPLIDAKTLARHWPIVWALLTNFAVTLVAGSDLIVHGVAGLSARRDGAAHALDEALAAKARSIAVASER